MMHCKCPSCGHEFEPEMEEEYEEEGGEEQPELESAIQDESMKVVEVKEVPEEKNEEIKKKLMEIGKLLKSLE
jgi:phage terminase large subunit GpA-like protein